MRIPLDDSWMPYSRERVSVKITVTELISGKVHEIEVPEAENVIHGVEYHERELQFGKDDSLVTQPERVKMLWLTLVPVQQERGPLYIIRRDQHG